MKEPVYVPDGFANSAIGSDLLHGWLDLLKRYEELELQQPKKGKAKPDVAYWYGERSLTGLLAAAAWRLEDGWSLVEYGAKVCETSKKTRACGDLWIGRGSHGATVEAKLEWVDGEVKTAQGKIRNQLNAAAAQLHDLKANYRVDVPVSICYVVPDYYRSSDGKIAGINALTELACWVRSTGRMASALHINENAQGKHRAYPGVLLIARQESWPDDSAIRD